MLFMTISVFSGALSMKKSLSTNLENCAPVDVNLVKPAEGKSIQKVMEEGGFSLKKELADMAEYTIYQNDMEEKDFYGDSLQEVEKAYPHVGFGNKVRFMTIGDYNRIARLYGKDTYELKKDQYMVIADYKQMVLVRNIPLGRGQSLEINGKKYIPKYRECQEGFVELAAQQLNGGIVLVPDGAVTKDQSSVWGISGNYKAADREGKQEQGKTAEQGDQKGTKGCQRYERLGVSEYQTGYSPEQCRTGGTGYFCCPVSGNYFPYKQCGDPGTEGTVGKC